MNIKGSLYDSAWCVALRKTDFPIFQNKDDRSSFKILKNSLRYWCADPFLFSRDGKLYIFMELYDMFFQKGVIGYRILHRGKLSRIHVCLKTPYHLSYPYVFEKDGEVYMLPECCQSGKLTMYKAVTFPDHWEPCEDLLTDTAVCDTDYVCNASGEYLLTTPVAIENNKFVYNTLSLYRKIDGIWQEHGMSPILRDASRARNAGMPFAHEGKQYRQAQNCLDRYGENLIFHEIMKLDENGYAEKKVAEVSVHDISVAGTKRQYSGIHTYNAINGYEVIDLFCASVLQPIRFLSLLLGKLSRRKR